MELIIKKSFLKNESEHNRLSVFEKNGTKYLQLETSDGASFSYKSVTKIEADIEPFTFNLDRKGIQLMKSRGDVCVLSVSEKFMYLKNDNFEFKINNYVDYTFMSAGKEKYPINLEISDLFSASKFADPKAVNKVLNGSIVYPNGVLGTDGKQAFRHKCETGIKQLISVPVSILGMLDETANYSVFVAEDHKKIIFAKGAELLISSLYEGACSITDKVFQHASEKLTVASNELHQAINDMKLVDTTFIIETRSKITLNSGNEMAELTKIFDNEQQIDKAKFSCAYTLNCLNAFDKHCDVYIGNKMFYCSNQEGNKEAFCMMIAMH